VRRNLGEALSSAKATVATNARLYEELQDADRRKDEFLAMLAHELRNPLAPVRNALQIMKLAAMDETAVEQAREMAERQIHQLTRLVDDLMDVSRITRGKIQLRIKAAELGAIMAGAVEASPRKVYRFSRPSYNSSHLPINRGLPLKTPRSSKASTRRRIGDIRVLNVRRESVPSRTRCQSANIASTSRINSRPNRFTCWSWLSINAWKSRLKCAQHHWICSKRAYIFARSQPTAPPNCLPTWAYNSSAFRDNDELRRLGGHSPTVALGRVFVPVGAMGKADTPR
jgi:hypothetical protein